MAKRRKILILDGHSLAFRAYHALPGTLARADGTPTNAVVGFCNMVAKLLEQEKPDGAICAFDRAAPTFRHTEFGDYKAHRKPMDESLIMQMPIIREAAGAFGLSVLEQDGYEADDMIGTVARLADETGTDLLIVTGDRDALQLVSDHVSVALTKKGISEFEVITPKTVKERYGFGPELIPDLKGLMGDASDNIPGVKGIGEKTAMKLVAEMGSIESIIENVHAIKAERLRRLILENRDSALLSKRLATIDRTAPVDVDLNACCAVMRDEDRLISFLEKQGMRSMISRLKPRNPEPAIMTLNLCAHEGVDMEIIRNSARLEEISALLARSSSLCMDVVATGRGRDVRVQAIAIRSDSDGYYIPIDGNTLPASLKTVFEDERIPKLCHDAKAKIMAMRALGADLSGIAFDTMVAGYLADPAAKNAEICDVVGRWLGAEAPSVQEASKAWIHGSCPDGLGATLMAQCLVHLPAIEARLMATISTLGMERLFREIEMPLVRVLADMETLGIKIDIPRLKMLGAEFDERLKACADQIYDSAGERFNINSPKQLGDILFEKLKLPPMKKTKTGYSTDAEVLEALSDKHEVVSKILDYRAMAKLKSTYVDALPGLADSEGRVHTSFNQTVTATGRLSSTDPNLQNIPIRTEEGRKIREVFIPGHPGWVIMSADYSQIELRVLAHISRDPVLMESFNRDEDVHRRTASEVFGVPFDLVSPEMRSRAKAVNFGIVYGISDYGLARNIHVHPSEAKQFIDRYFARYHGVKAYMDSVVAQAKRDGYVTTLLNRRRYLPELSSPNLQVRKFAERVAMNTPIQGTAADIIKAAMVKVHSGLKGTRSRLLLQVHDELVLEVHPAEIDSISQMVRSAMETAVGLSIPLKVDISSGPNWNEAK